MRHHRWHDRPRAEMACAAPDDAARKPYVGLRLALLIVLSPLLAIGFLWLSYAVVSLLGIGMVIVEALLS